LRFPSLNFGAIFSVTWTCFVGGTCRSTWKRHTHDVRHGVLERGIFMDFSKMLQEKLLLVGGSPLRIPLR
jgi:hypothetical protein